VPYELPSLSVIGTGKRVGKTAVTGAIARRLARERKVVVVAMGRGGPPAPELIERPPTLDDLLALSRSGRHAASDHLETAALVGVPTIGCRRAGQVFESNVVAGAELARSLDPHVVVFDGSGAAIPPVATTARILVVGAEHDLDDYLNPYRVLISDLIVRVGGGAAPTIKNVPVVDVELRLRPLEPLRGRRTAVFTTGAAPVDRLDAEVVHVSRGLADRATLRDELARIDADVFLVELKAAAIDVVAETAAARGVALVLAENEVIAPGLDYALARLLPAEVPA